jgi:hypothetical protein
MIYRRPGFLAVTWFGSSPTLPPLLSASCLSFSVFLSVAGRAYTVYWREKGGGGAKPYDGDKAWSSKTSFSTLWFIITLNHCFRTLFDFCRCSKFGALSQAYKYFSFTRTYQSRDTFDKTVISGFMNDVVCNHKELLQHSWPARSV